MPIEENKLVEILEDRRISEARNFEVHGILCRICGEELEYFGDGRFIHKYRGKDYDHPATPPHKI